MDFAMDHTTVKPQYCFDRAPRYQLLLDGNGGHTLAKEVGKGAWQLDADPPAVARPKRNKAKTKAQRNARKRK